MAEDYHTAHPPGSGEHQGGTVREPTIRVESCRGDGRCPECGEGSAFPFRLLCGCSPCLSSACSLNHTRALLTEALRQRDAIDEAQHHGCTLAEDHPTLRLLAAVRAERDAALRKGAAERAMLDEILALPDIEAPTGDGSENVAAVVASALEALREERDAAIRQVEEQRHPCPCGKDTASIKWARCYSCRQRDTEERDAAIREHQRALGEAAEIAQGLQSKLDEAIRERDLARAHDAQPYPTAEAYERVCAALEATKRSLEQTRAAMEAGDACTVCAGTGKPVSGKPCICGGHGGIGNQIIGLTREAQRAHEKAAQFEADWMAAKYEFGVTLTAERERAEKAEATVARQAQRIQQQEVAWSASQARAEKAEALLLECREAVDYAAWAADEEFDEPHMKKFRDLLSRLPTLKEP